VLGLDQELRDARHNFSSGQCSVVSGQKSSGTVHVCPAEC
jgi:hypothetical protein